MSPEVNWFFTKNSKWQDAYAALREIALDCDLTEELKWGCPCYTLNQSNIVLIHGFKDYCALQFMQGTLLKDAGQILIQQTKNVQSAGQLRFKGIKEILENKSIIATYKKEAIALDKSGLKLELKKTSEYNIPDEFKKVLYDMPELNTAFNSLTPGHQRGYLLYFSSAKQAETRKARIERHLQHILEGKALDD